MSTMESESPYLSLQQPGAGYLAPGTAGAPNYGSQQAPASPYAPQQMQASGGGGSGATKVEVNVVGTFPNPWKGKPAEEGKAILAKPSPWEPSTVDFEEVAGRPKASKLKRAESFAMLLGAILEEKPGSIKQLNIFSHANSDDVGLKGEIKPETTTALVSWTASMNEDWLEKLENGMTIQLPKRGKQKYTIDDVKKRFAPDAVIVLYACRTGLDRSFQKRVAEVFGVRVIGFKEVVKWEIDVVDGKPLRSSLRVGLGVKGQTYKDFHELMKSGVESKP